MSRFITPKALTARLNVTLATLYTWRKNGTGPPWVRIGKSAIRYPAAEFNAWIARNTTNEQTKGQT
jgi:predicted DNA-binding transcriptional regulator AlpA